MAAGLIVFNFNLREYVGEVTGLNAEVSALVDADRSLTRRRSAAAASQDA